MTDLTCDDLQDLLGDLVAGDLAVDVVVIVERHLGTCPHCGGRLELYKATIILTRALPRNPDPLPPAVEARLRRRMLTDGHE